MEEPACKPDPVRGAHAPPTTISLGDARKHRRRAVHRPGAAYPAARAGRPRTLPARPCSGWGLPAATVARRAGALLPHRFTLTPRDLRRVGRSALCCPVREVTPAWPFASTLPFGVRTFLERSKPPAAVRPAPPRPRIPAVDCRTMMRRTIARVATACTLATACAAQVDGPANPASEIRGAPAMLQTQVRGAALRFVEAYRTTLLGGHDLEALAATPLMRRFGYWLAVTNRAFPGDITATSTVSAVGPAISVGRRRPGGRGARRAGRSRGAATRRRSPSALGTAGRAGAVGGDRARVPGGSSISCVSGGP